MKQTLSVCFASMLAWSVAGAASAQEGGEGASASTPPAATAPADGGPASVGAETAEGTEGAEQVAAQGTATPISTVACLAPPSGASAAEVSRFIDQPGELLTNYGMTSLDLSSRIRALVGADTRALDGALALLAVASADQRTAIGAGLGRAAFSCQERNETYAAEIQSKVADLQFSDVKTAFVAATNDIQVAAIAGAAGGATGGASAPGLAGGGEAGPGTAGLGGDDTVPTASGSFPVGNSSGFSYLEGRGGGSLTTVISVSPTTTD